MRLELNQDGLCLKRKQVLKVRGGVGHAIVCHHGSVWVTQDGDRRDIILGAGESFAFDRSGTALVQAFEQSAVSFVPPAPASSAALSPRAPGRAVAGLTRVAPGA